MLLWPNLAIANNELLDECVASLEMCNVATQEAEKELKLAEDQLAVQRELIRELTLQRNEAYQMVEQNKSLPWYYHSVLGAAATATCLNASDTACGVAIGGFILMEIIGGLAN